MRSIYNFCHDENDLLALTLDALGNTAFEAFFDNITDTLNKQWENHSKNVDVSKDDRHVLRLAAVFHLFYDQLGESGKHVLFKRRACVDVA